MLLKGAISSEKTLILANKYAELLNSGIDASEILVLLQNSSKKNQFSEHVFEKLKINSVEKMQIYSFFGLVYNTISDNWAFIENQIPEEKNTKILPNLIGLEVSQFIMKDVVKDVKFEGYNSKKSLLHQLFRRYSLIVQNNLTEEDIKWRSEEILKESFAPDAKKALAEFKHKTLDLRSFDYLRQSLIFNHIYKSTNYFSKIKYLILDDGDEVTPICLDFIKWLKPQLKDFFIAYDSPGGSRSGYLSANKMAPLEFETFFNQQPEMLEAKSALKEDAQTLFENIMEDKAQKLKNFSLLSFSKRAQMIEKVNEKIKSLIKSNVKPSEIAVITPIIDDMLKFSLKNSIKKNWANLLFLSGSEKIIQNPIVHSALTILKLSDPNLKYELSSYDIRNIFIDFLHIPLKYCKEILDEFEKTKTFKAYEFKDSEYSEKYSNFANLIQTLSQKKMKLSEQVFFIYKEFAQLSLYSFSELNKLNFFIKQIQDFETVFDNSKISNSEIINQIENSIISENPYSSLEIKEQDLVIATPQKIIDNQIQTKYQIWLDLSSDEWIKNDTGPLYNAWVFQSTWNKKEFTMQDNIELSRQKNARVLRKLMLCANEKIYGYASLFDGSGIENFGGIEKYLKFDAKENVVTAPREIIPRSDQKPVLEYKSGTMAISAVPGAGKTTILLALILKLLEGEIKPENIFVLTYMESAARNFRERIQNTMQNLTQLPNISTIHGLALKILKENANYERLGLNTDFEICDDTQRSRILREISAKLGIKPKEQEDFDRAVSVLKMSGGENNNPISPNKKLEKFLLFYGEYKNVLQSNNLIDYDDMLLFSVKLLEENPDILEYYQELCQYIIEDEAQDSSAIQQKLINFLSSKHKNLIRCGDINQAITTTFSNADVEGFRRFIKNSDTQVSMDCSQRCSKGVWTLANTLVKYAQTNPHTKDAFYEIFMHPVDGKNPEEKNAISPWLFENSFAEKNYILKQIKTLMTKNPHATFGILLRSNYQVASWMKFISEAGLKSITRSECLEQKPVFRTIFAILKFLEKPFDNQNLADCYDTLSELRHCKANLYAEIKNFETPFIESNVDKIKNQDLADFYWMIDYWLSLASLPVEELAIKIGLYYYKSEVEKSNVYLISTLIKRLNLQYKNYSELIQRLSELSKKPSLSGFKFFSEEDESSREFMEGKVQIMTLHKSKGDEFDFVFLPEMSESNLSLDFEKLKLKANARFMEDVREINPSYKPKTDDDLKEFLLAENFRLLYVAITRAKRKLFITAAKTTKSFGQMKEVDVSVIFDALLETKEFKKDA